MVHHHTALLLVLFGSLAQAAPSAEKGNDIRVEIVGLRNDRGTLRCALFASPDGFPSNANKTARATTASVEQGRASCRFQGVTPGVYAISFYQDENQNERLDTGFLGRPKEGYGASRNAHRSFGPPKFEDARFEHDGGPADFQLRAFY